MIEGGHVQKFSKELIDVRKPCKYNLIKSDFTQLSIKVDYCTDNGTPESPMMCIKYLEYISKKFRNSFQVNKSYNEVGSIHVFLLKL